MRKAAFQVLTLALLASLLASYALPLLADDEPDSGPKPRKPLKVRQGQRGKSNVAHLYLFEKDPETWDIVRGRGRNRWAKIKYTLTGDEFQFHINAHGLTSEEAYNLIYYPDPWPGEELVSLGGGEANMGGNLHLAGSVDTGDLPSLSDWNHYQYDGSRGDRPEDWGVTEDWYGAKIWLVLSDDVDFEQRKMVDWNPARYLFEYDLITFDYTD